jgi:hypothetical protein
MMKQFDKDGDGQLDESEREAMRTAMQARFGRQGGSRFNREEMLKRFDKNSDGELDEDERAAMRESMGNSRGERGSRRQQDDAASSSSNEKTENTPGQAPSLAQ